MGIALIKFLVSHIQCNDSPGRVVFWAPAAELTELKLAAQRWVAEQFIIVFFLFDVVLNFFLGYSQLWSPLTGLEIRTPAKGSVWNNTEVMFSLETYCWFPPLKTMQNIWKLYQKVGLDPKRAKLD